MKRKLYQIIASKIVAMKNCVEMHNHEWYPKHREAIEQLVKDYFPHGSGIDGSHGEFDYDKSNDKRLVFYSSYHFMNDGGFYDGWYDFTIYIESSLAMGFNINITIPKRMKNHGVDDYLAEMYQCAFDQEVEEYHAEVK